MPDSIASIILFLPYLFMEYKHLSLLIALLTTASVLFLQSPPSNPSNSIISQFQLWKSQHQISFSPLENAYREKIFLQNQAHILLHNSKPHQSYQLGLNQFSALTNQEFQQLYLALIIQTPKLTVQNHYQNSQQPLPTEEIDWTTKGAVTDIKDQGQCGSCWAFSATGALQALSKISYGSLKSFSQQQLVDCSSSYGNEGCNGGLMNSAFKFVKDKGIALESEYPYKAVDQKCKKPSGDFKISGYVEIKNCNDLAAALSQRPVSVAVDASNWSMYSSGVFNNCDEFLNHGVLLVGSNDQFWRVKNSWGTSWGQAGFIRLAKGNTCGVCSAASYPNK